jgi:L-ascorbate metabolism protein UlaG (beta-lactamase superfamily)
MDNEKVYLKQNVLAEPLFNQWYAWSLLIAPVQAAMYTLNWHLKIMQSFVAAPQAHVAALKNPTMIGGPFINYSPARAREIGSLIEKTRTEQAALIEFAEGVKILHAVLEAKADGGSLEPLYKQVPDSLKGFVELVYDLNNNPSIRFIEGLLYKSRYYNEASQTLSLSLIDKSTARPFAFSTPKLHDDSWIDIHLPFRSEHLDELFKMKAVPARYENIRDVLGVRGNESLFRSFFTREAPGICPRYNGEGVRVRYFGHACLLIETRQASILCDPLINYNCGGDVASYTFEDLPDRIDYLLITHNHQDHCMFETLLQLRHKVGTVVIPRSNVGSLEDPSLKLVLQHIGFNDVREIEEMEAIDFDGGTIISLPFLGEHGDLNIRTKSAYFIRANGKSMLVAADSNNIAPELYERVHKLLGEVDLLFIGMECDGAPMSWVYGPLLIKPLPRKFDQSRRFDGSNAEKALGIVDILKPEQVYVYAMGQEPWLTYLTSIQYTEASRPIVESNKLIDACHRQGRISERLFGQKDILLS